MYKYPGIGDLGGSTFKVLNGESLEIYIVIYIHRGVVQSVAIRAHNNNL